MNRNLVILLLVAGLVAGLFVAAGLDDSADPLLGEPRAATVLPAPAELPDFELTDHTGTTRTREVLMEGWHLLFFGFTHCPDICPTTLATLASATRALADSGYGNVPGIVLVSVDPDRDSPEKLAEYIAHFGADSIALTGDEAAVRELTEPLFIYFQKVPLGDDEYTVDHSSVVLLINPDGEFHALFSGPVRVEDLVHDLPLIIGSS
jgi:protein SCO1/2